MNADIECYYCCINKMKNLLKQYNVNNSDSIDIIKDVFFAVSTMDKNTSAPVLMSKAINILENKLGITDTYSNVKKIYNDILMKKESRIFQDILDSDDMFLTGIRYAAIGNYIDFGAMDSVDEKKLEELISKKDTIEFSNRELEAIKKELFCAKKLLYITDNAGEIVLDKIFIKVLKRIYTNLDITVMVRGMPALNDATLNDANDIGMSDIANLISNGTAIPGTVIDKLSKEAFHAIHEADLCIAKGQGNFETLRGCGINIYYIFLCKCDLFVQKFGVEKFTAILQNENRIVHYV